MTFQSTPPRGWRPCHPVRPSGRSSYFNPLHREGGDGCLLRRHTRPAYFNPLHREGGDCIYPGIPHKRHISIHSTARVETFIFIQMCRNIHDFNPLHREGGDGCRDDISTDTANFNPLHREGGDLSLPVPALRPGVFQSTPPRGWRLQTEQIYNGRSYFNPLHREGGDVIGFLDSVFYMEFQSTPPRGWRLTKAFKILIYSVFQSTPPRGWRQKYYTITTTILHHISTNKSYPTPLKSRPTIPAHSQIRSHCANFPVRIPP